MRIGKGMLTAGFLALAASQAQADPAAMQGVIGAQISAFQADDFATAFTYASPTIRDMFGTSENFGRMVRSGYPMVWRPDSVRYLDQRDVAGRLFQRVMVTDASGAIHLLDYEMIEGETGWKINGVFLLREGGAGA